MRNRDQCKDNLRDISSRHKEDRCAQSGPIRLTNTSHSCGLTHSFSAPTPPFRLRADLAYTPPIPNLQSRAALTPRLRRHSLSADIWP